MPPSSGHSLPLCRHIDLTAVLMPCFWFTDPQHYRCFGNPQRAAERCSPELLGSNPLASLALMSLSPRSLALVSHCGPDRIDRFSKKNTRCPVKFEFQINKSFFSMSHAITGHAVFYLAPIGAECIHGVCQGSALPSYWAPPGSLTQA